MATRTAVVQVSGQFQQLQAGDALDLSLGTALPIAGISGLGSNQATRLAAAMPWIDETFFMLAANGSAIGATIADYFASGGNNAFSTATNGIYLIEFNLWFLKTTAGTVVWTILNSQTYTNIVAWLDQAAGAGITPAANTGGSGIVTTAAAAAALPPTPSLTTAVNHHSRVFAIAEVGTAGNIRLQATESAGTITPLRGSCYRVWRAASASVGTFVA